MQMEQNEPPDLVLLLSILGGVFACCIGYKLHKYRRRRAEKQRVRADKPVRAFSSLFFVEEGETFNKELDNSVSA